MHKMSLPVAGVGIVDLVERKIETLLGGSIVIFVADENRIAVWGIEGDIREEQVDLLSKALDTYVPKEVVANVSKVIFANEESCRLSNWTAMDCLILLKDGKVSAMDFVPANNENLN